MSELRKSYTGTRRTVYVAGAQYKDDSLEFISMAHGRVVKQEGSWEYEYFLNDHLGNTRLTYGYTSETNDYLATMESERSSEENAEFTQLDPKSLNYNHTPAKLELQQPDESLLLRASPNSQTGVMGAGNYLKVKAGDKITVEAFAHYNSQSGNPAKIGSGIIAAVSGAFGAVGGAESANIQTAFNDNLGSILNTMGSSTGIHAYVMYVLFNEDYTDHRAGWDFVETQAAAGWQKLELPGKTVDMVFDGHLFIYVANQSEIDTYFDDLKIIHEKQNNKLQVTQSQDYYPFGLTYNAYQKEVPSVNQYKFQGQEHQADFDLGWSQFKWRNSDPSIGRFFNIDPIAEDYYYNSTYAFSENRLTDGVELEGLEWKPIKNKNGQYISFSWDPENAYNWHPPMSNDYRGELREGYFKSAILFSPTNVESKLSNITESFHSTATVFKEDGTTSSFGATTRPSSIQRFGWVKEGIYLARKGTHPMSGGYPALNLFTLDGSRFLPSYGVNPAGGGYDNNEYTVDGVNIHKAGTFDYLGLYGNGRGISEGCPLIQCQSINDFDKFLQNFEMNQDIPVIIIDPMQNLNEWYYDLQEIPSLSYPQGDL